VNFPRKNMAAIAIAALIFSIATGSGVSSAQAVSGASVYVAKMTQPHLPSAPNGGTDDYRCFLIDPKIPQDSLITQVEFRPQQRVMMHHAIMFLVGKKDLSAAIAIDKNGTGWPCFGGTGLGSSFSSFLTSPWLSSWAPGRDKDVMPTGYGTPIAKGDRIVLQVHYNLLAVGSGKIPTDQSSVRITAVAAKGAHLGTLYSELVAAPVELACPKGVTGYLCDRGKSLIDLSRRTSPSSAMESVGLNLICGKNAVDPTPNTTSTCDKKITENELVVKATPHMHLLGRSLKMILNPGTPGEKILLDRPNYNFDDQSPTILKKPIALKVGDTVRVECTFDPTLRSLLPELKKLPPRYVTWGEGSSDEMCLGVLGVAHQG
jgi:Copper type II ascorbate-dependent monooxygenase, C-terminal domain